jgi:hypothetical protein
MSVYTFISNASVGGFRWAYAAPDTNATINGALTVNSPFWIGMGTHNQALPT